VPGEAIAEAYDAFEKGQTLSPLATAAVSNQTIQESMRLVLLVRAFQVRAATLCISSSSSSMCISCTAVAAEEGAGRRQQSSIGMAETPQTPQAQQGASRMSTAPPPGVTHTPVPRLQGCWFPTHGLHHKAAENQQQLVVQEQCSRSSVQRPRRGRPIQCASASSSSR
jgi:hypothetical protein